MWLEPAPIQVSDDLRSAVGGHPLVAELLARRGLIEPQAALAFLDPDRYTPASPSDLPDLEVAAEHLHQAIRERRRILVWGDFDVDGQTSTTLLYSVLHDLGADVSYYVPQRLKESHGIKIRSLDRLIDERKVDVLLTCDTGISEAAAIAHAKVRGLMVLVTDHHDLAQLLPPADAVVNPKRLPREHALHELPGVGVAFMLAQQLFAIGNNMDHTIGDRSRLVLDLVALGIVADVAQQVDDTRYLLQRGLDQLRRPARLGLQVLMQAAKVDPAQLSAEHIGFALGPRLNALGRLGDASLAVELLTTNDLSRARIIAAQIEGLNNQRRMLAEQIYAAAQEQIAKDVSLLDRSVLVLTSPHWHAGVIGPVANRLTEKYGRPALLLVVGEDGIARGSARSVTGVDISAALAMVRERLIGFGGHPGAAGMSLKADDVSIFRSELSRAVDAVWDRTITPAGTPIDAYVALNEVTLELAQQIERLAPFGAGNPEVMLAVPNVTIANVRAFGRRGEHREVTIADEQGNERQLVWWRGAEEELPAGKLDVALHIKSTDYRGATKLSIEWVDARVIEAPLVEIVSTIDVIDWRREADEDVKRRVRESVAAGDVIVWCDGELPKDMSARRRTDLEKAKRLVVWRAPVGPKELESALQQVDPHVVYLCAIDRAQISFGEFIKRLSGLVMHDLNRREGRIDMPRLAVALGQRLILTRKGVELLAARGQIAIVGGEGDELRIAKVGKEPEDVSEIPPYIAEPIDADELKLQIDALLSETAAYQAYYRRADARKLVDGA